MSTIIVNSIQPLSGTNLTVLGDVTANAYYGDGSNLTGIVAGAGVIPTTYAELVDRITGQTLTAGAHYIITDFKTCYDQPDFDVYGNPVTGDNYKEASVDPIIVLAVSSNTISTTAYQPSYPKDRIQYDWTFGTTEVTGGPAYGRITERIDEFSNRTDYDHRTILFKRYMYLEINIDSPYQGRVRVTATSPTEMTVSGTGTSFTSLNVGDLVGFENTDFKAYSVVGISGNTEMYITGMTNLNMNNVEMYPAYTTDWNSYRPNNIENAFYYEYHTFDYENDNFNNYIGNYSDMYVYEEATFLLANNVLRGSTFRNNTFGNTCFNNTFNDDCENNTIGNYFCNNVTDDDFDGNLIGNYFSNNRITANFQYNRIGENFQDNYIVQQSFYRNNIMNYFSSNRISGNDFQNNEIGSQFGNNVIRYGQFYKNDIGNGFNSNRIYWAFYGNLIGNGFNANNVYCEFNSNVIGEYYNDNTLGDINEPSSNVFSENRIGNSYNNNIVASDFYKNLIGENFYNNEISGQTTHNFIGNSFESNTILNNFNRNSISSDFKGNLMMQEFELNNVDSYVAGNQFLGPAYSNDIGDFTFDNDFSGFTTDNTWDGNFYQNRIEGDFYSNTIGHSFYGNTIGLGFQFNSIGKNFYDNNIGDNFGYGYTTTQGNRIGNNFFYNNIGEYFYNNTIADNFFGNEVGNYFQWNVIETNIDSTYFTLNYGNLSGFSYAAVGTGATNNFYSGIQICGTTESKGVGATFDVEVSGGVVIGVSGKTQGRLYAIGDVLRILGTQIGGVTGLINGFTSDAVGKSGVSGLYTNIAATGTGGGGGATFDISVTNGSVDAMGINNRGTGYSAANLLSIAGSAFGGVDGVDDIEISVTSVYSDDIVITVTSATSGSSFYDHYTKQVFERKGGNKRVSFYDEHDVLNVNSVYEISGYIPVYSQQLTFPHTYTSFEFRCNGNYVNQGGYTNQTVHNVQELVALFNSNFRSFGYFFDNNDGTIGLYINPSLKQQYCPNGTYSIYVFND